MQRERGAKSVNSGLNLLCVKRPLSLYWIQVIKVNMLMHAKILNNNLINKDFPLP